MTLYGNPQLHVKMSPSQINIYSIQSMPVLKVNIIIVYPWDVVLIFMLPDKFENNVKLNFRNIVSNANDHNRCPKILFS
jgi:hypothetical protein